MTSAIELSVRFGLPIGKITEICDYLDVDLDQEDFEIDGEFQHIARSIKRKRAGAYALAFLYAHASEEQREFIFAIDPDFREEYLSLRLPIMDSEKLLGASGLIKKLADTDTNYGVAWDSFALWVKARIGEAGTPIGHSYLAVRLLLSLPSNVMRDYPATIATVLNRARHRRYLDGWHSTVQRDGKNVVLYHRPDAIAPAEPAIEIDLTYDEVTKFAARLGSNEPAALASFIAYEKKLDIKKVSAFLKQKPFDL